MVPIEDYDISSDSTPEKSYMSMETKRDKESAVMSLPEKYRIMIVYYHFMNLSYQEISDMLNEPMTIVKNRLYRARLMLKQSLFSGEGDYNGLQSSI
jgi:RNA polymerase sigma-70 factor (ECF subfamily)